VQFRNLVNQIVLKLARVVNETVETLNVSRNDRGIAWILVCGRHVKPGVADLASNGSNFVKNSPHHGVIRGVVRIGMVRITKTQ
jgi:hypothetical protein